MPVMPNYNAQVNPDIGGAQRVQTGGEAIGQGLQNLGSGISEAAIGLNHFNKLQAQKSEYQSNVNTDVFKAQQKPLIDDAIKNAPVNGDGITKSALAAYDKNVAAFLPTIPEAMRYKVKGELDVYRAGFANLATDAEHRTGVQYSLDTIKESYTSTQEAVKQNPGERGTLQQGLFDRIDQAPYLTPLQRKELKDGYVNGIAIAEVKGLGGDDPDKIKALRDGTYAQKYGPGAADGLWKTMITKVENQSGDPGAVSSKGALGVAQVMPDTAREVARKLGMENVAYMNDAELQRYFKANPAVNEKIGRAYFDQQLQRYGGDQQAAVVAYNAGPGVADKYVASGKDPSILPEETQNYLGKVFGGGTQSEEEAPDNMPDASSSVPNNATPDTIGLSRYLVAGKGMEHIRGMQKPLQQGLQAMLDAAPPGVKEYLKIMSGYRSPERQQQLWDAALKKYGSAAAARKWVAPPGNSQHNHGNAADLAFDGAGTTAKLSQAGQAAMQWAHANASKFGLVFPLSNEPWHVEVAGARGGASSAPNVSAGSDSGSSPAPGPAQQFASISMEQWDALVNSARSQQNQNQAIARGNLEPRVQDATAALMTTGRFDGAMPSQQDFTAAYGTIEGAQRFAQFRQVQDIGEHIDAFKSMTPQQIQADIEASKPIDSGAGFAMAQARYEAMAKAGAATIKLRDDDPAKYAITVSPGIAAKWRDANTPEGYRTALGAMAAFQSQIGVPTQNQKLLPDDRAQKVIAQYKNNDMPFEQRVGAVKAAVLMTSDLAQQKAVFRQLVNEGLPPEAEAALDRYAGGEQGAGDRLMTALMTDPTKLPAGAVTATPKDIKEQIQSTYSTWFDGRYGVSSGNPANLKAAEGAADLLTKATHLRLAQGAPDVQTAMAGAAQDLFGKDFKLMQATPNGRGASVAVPAGINPDDLGQHLDEAMPAVIRTLANNIERSVSGFDKMEPGQLAALAADAANEARTLVANGKWVNTQGGYGFLDTKSGRLIETSPGKPLVIRMGEAIPEVPDLQSQQPQQPAPVTPTAPAAAPAAPVAAPAANATPAPAPGNLPPINPTPADKVKAGLSNIQDQARQLREKALDPDQVESGGFFSGFFSGDGN